MNAHRIRFSASRLAVLLALSALLFLPASCTPAGSDPEALETREQIERVTEELEREQTRMEKLRDEFTRLTREVENLAISQTESLKPAAEEWTQKTQDEWKALNRWEYRTIIASATDTPLDAVLNGAGSEGWELVSIADIEGETVLVFKRRPESVFRSIPARDLLRLIPLLGR